MADFYEAVTSKRHYREPMPTNVAVRLVREQSGTAFDPVVVDAFLRYLEESENGGPQDREGGDGEGKKVCVLRKSRVPVKAEAEIKTERGSIKGQAHDVSDSGAYLSVSEDMAEGLMIRVTLHLPGYDRPLEAAGRELGRRVRQLVGDRGPDRLGRRARPGHPGAGGASARFALGSL